MLHDRLVAFHKTEHVLRTILINILYLKPITIYFVIIKRVIGLRGQPL